jgi:hypothetical protein
VDHARLAVAVVAFLVCSVPFARADDPPPASPPLASSVDGAAVAARADHAAGEEAEAPARRRRSERYRPGRPVLEVAAPAVLSIPTIGVSTPLLELGTNSDGSLQVPGDPDRAGWFTGGPRPGEAGPAVIVGHVDSWRGPAIFYRLRELQPGDEVVVERRDGTTARFAVRGAQAFPKSGFPTDAVFGPTPGAALRLITCHGAFDRARDSYVDNLVVFTTLVPTGDD